MDKHNSFLNLGAMVLLVSVLSISFLQGPFQNKEERDLESRVADLEKVVLQQQETIDKMEKDIDKLNRLGESLAKGALVLNRAIDSSRKNGFEAAGPNPQAKTDLLEGLKG